MARPPRRELGIRLIVAYKLAKAVLEAALAVAVVGLAATGRLAPLRALALELRHDVASRWALIAGRALSSLFSARGVRLVELGLALDAALSAVEGWSLWRRARWGPWLVVVASGLPLPLEVEHLLRHPSLPRVALAAANAAVVAYLAVRIRREHAARR